MNTERKDFYKAEYLRRSVDELAGLVDEMSSNPSRYAPEATAALKEALRERNLDRISLLNELRSGQSKDSQVVRTRERTKRARSKTFNRRLGRVLGFLGIPMSIAVAGLSLSQAHFGGLAASMLWFGCSIWMAFYYRGD